MTKISLNFNKTITNENFNFLGGIKIKKIQFNK